MSLRREKSAKLKFQLLENTLKMVGRRSFDDLHIEDLCARVKISKVTFFKYFPQKEDLLLYYFRIWCFKCAVELTIKPREGKQGIFWLFDKLSEAYEEYPGILTGLVGYLPDMKRSPKPFPVKPEEKKLFNPEHAGVEILSVDQMLEKFVLEAIFRKEITRTTSTRDLTNMLNALFFGSVIIAYLNPTVPSKLFFRKNVEMVL